MSAIGGTAVNIFSLRGLPVLTQSCTEKMWETHTEALGNGRALSCVSKASAAVHSTQKWCSACCTRRNSQVHDVLLSEHVLQEREDVAMCLLHGDFVIVGRCAPLETRIGRTERLFRLYVKDNATLAFGETASAT